MHRCRSFGDEPSGYRLSATGDDPEPELLDRGQERTRIVEREVDRYMPLLLCRTRLPAPPRLQVLPRWAPIWRTNPPDVPKHDTEPIWVGMSASWPPPSIARGTHREPVTWRYFDGIRAIESNDVAANTVAELLSPRLELYRVCIRAVGHEPRECHAGLKNLR